MDAVPIKPRIEVARSSKCLLIYGTGGSSAWLTIFRSHGSLVQFTLDGLLVVPSAVLHRIEIGARENTELNQDLLLSLACWNMQLTFPRYL